LIHFLSETENMSTQNNQSRTIDLLALSDSEKIEFLRAAREALQQRIEEARFCETSSKAME
jgi:hypothetical protein